MLIGKRISGRYKLLEMIGGGGMSNVYLAHDMILDRDVAIKVLRYDFSNEEELHRRFQREALSATSLTHPHIVNIYDVGEDEDIHYIVMEYVKGDTLKEYILLNAPVSPTKSVKIMKQLTSAISAAHNNHIIHRDIKPQNILLDEEENVKVTDFGIAMALSATSYTQTNSVLGTVHYLSPEQARGGTATKQSDIYALGIVLFELLTGQLPFSGESAVSIALKHLQTETPSIRKIIPSIPQSIENVVLKATAKDPKDRYLSAEEMEADLATALTPERAGEEKFVVAIDDDATKVLPVIKEPVSFNEVSDTKKMSASNKVPKPVKPKTKNKKRKVIGGVIGGVILLLLLIFIVFPGLFKADKIQVPDVSNLELEEAIEQLESEGFTIGDETLEVSDEVEENKIIRTSPEAGKLREKNSEIHLFVSSGKETFVLENYVGKDIDQVLILLQNQDLRIDVKEVFDDQPKGTILKQTPVEGEEVIPDETDILFTVSNGPDLRTVSNLTDWNEKALSDYEKSSGFKIRVAERRNSDSIPKGNVIDQNPKPNAKVSPGSTIEVTLSDGPKAKPTKFVVKSVTIPYEQPIVEEENEEDDSDEEENKEKPVVQEQVVRIYIEDNTRSMAEPIEEFVLTETVVKQLKLEISEGKKAAYRIEINSTVFLQETIAYED
ncbi:Stk1 family PASTA domain-containing Ser/Thr kinase [Psychrobacillus sp. INOP01]|uniref:Stk1 family PASTA domain-containing Ser/Thr kinase n=1 Tax=Psychrobacillus sp. INOP01 TaxID=2829187 RepID=UPI001BA94AEC|nr:Stk1 family PASTA domain-containing Ser/Thr kinase [Psychrobacillus sp. INOP01]QUG41043.1 Stk1 family PASTA domain-containing Ser/Thr kinase [Psychrobacillus sp. INOP01]